jgi:hypothetical protein
MSRHHGRIVSAVNLCLAQHVIAPGRSAAFSLHRNFVQSLITQKKQEQIQHDDAQRDNSKKLSRGATSLRRVSIEAERSRSKLIINKAGRRFVDPDAETKVVVETGLLCHRSNIIPESHGILCCRAIQH